jgi:hypothetical protein
MTLTVTNAFPRSVRKSYEISMAGATLLSLAHLLLGQEGRHLHGEL